MARAQVAYEPDRPSEAGNGGSHRRFERQDAIRIIEEMQHEGIEQLDERFRRGSVPRFAEIEGRTRGGWLARRNRRFWADAFIKVALDSPWARWSGKGFWTSFDGVGTGRGANLFDNRILPTRLRYETFLRRAAFDGRPCLTLRYPVLSPMWGLVDDVRRVEEGVFLGQMLYKFPWEKRRLNLGYFALCALQPGQR